MLSEKIEKLFNKQIKIEAESSQIYLSMAIWCETKGYEGIASFMYANSDEERMHMLKLVKYVNERGGIAKISSLKEPAADFGTLKEMFTIVLNHEIFVSKSINAMVDLTFIEKDFASNNFLQWYVSEQIEEEAQSRNVLDKINMIGDNKGGLYQFDKDIKQLITQSEE